MQHILHAALGASFSLDGVQQALCAPALPANVLQHRLLEPLLWLKATGAAVRRHCAKAPAPKFKTSLRAPRITPGALRKSLSFWLSAKPTLRRQLSRTGDSFSKILRSTRLELGLARLQTTEASITEIALSCGFATPSHFSQAFKQRFGCMLKAIRSRWD